MLSNLLERRAFFGQTQGSAPTSTQLEINQLSDGFASSASDWKALASMSLGGFAFKLGKLATMGGLSSQVIGTGAGLLAEVATFRTLEALLRGQGIENAFEGKGFAATVLNFGLLKGVGSAFRSQNQIFIHTFQSGAMVVGHEWGARLSLVDAPSGTLVQQWIHAELMNIQMQAGAALVHATLPGLAMKERELGLRLETMVGASRWLAQGQGIASPLQQGKILPLMANENPLAPKPEEVVEIQGGRFVMGSRGPDSLKNEIPHLVELSPFRILRTPVTNAILFQHLGKYYSTPFAMIGRDQAGIWRVVQRGRSETELQAWMGDQEKGETVTSGGRLFARDSLSIHRVVPEHPVLQQGFEDINQPAVNISWAEAVSIADAMRGHLPTEAQWEFAARGPMVNVTEQMRAKGMDLANIAGFPYLVRGPYIAGRIERGFFGHYENFVAMDPVTGQMIGTEFFTDPNHLRIQQMLREGQAIGAWRVFSTESGAFKEAAIWSSVMRQRFSTRYVMEGKPGPFGLIDMNGNVSEWMNDWYGPYDTPGKVIQNPMGQMNGYYRVSRGGSWVNLLPRNLRAAYRNHCRPDKRTILVGLRVLVPQD